MLLHLPGFCRVEFRPKKRAAITGRPRCRLVYPSFSEALRFHLLEALA